MSEQPDVEHRLDRLEEKMDLIMEQVQLGRHLLLFAKMVGWTLGVMVSVLEAWRYLRGGNHG